MSPPEQFPFAHLLLFYFLVNTKMFFKKTKASDF